ncbi:FH2 domain-containing protein 1 isoform X2 [Pseudorasbora parva]|uniref:FH2 domain-containing protein 1 isoform X2 n=1 Tax=Pseudorasbora parva TaxID=51549 RepID=UPI00351EBA05
MSSVSLANERQRFDEEGGDGVLMTPPPVLHDHAPLYAPPPAPPLPPPLPVGKPGEKKRRVRSFFWKPIPEDRVKKQDGPNLWTLGRYSRKPAFHIDIRAIEELFGQYEDEPSSIASGGKTVGQSSGKNVERGQTSGKDLRQQISILDSKRSLNISIFLKHLKKSSECLLDDVLHGNTGIYSVESLRELLKLLPEEDEVKNLQMFSGNPKDLPPPDAFIHQLIHLPRYELRLKALLLKEEFFPSYTLMKHDIAMVLTAINELLNCEELHNVLHLVLQSGNIMNAGGSAGDAVGFKLSSLLSLADTKANKPGMNLLHFVALSTAEALEDLRIRIEELQREGDALVDFFCEDKDVFKLDECFRIFQNFCSKFKKAVQENVEREMREESRRKRLKEAEDKRHSWAGHEGVGGAFGLRSNSEADVEAALKREGLLELLMTSPHSSLMCFGSARRPRRQKTVTSDPWVADPLPPIHSLSITHSMTEEPEIRTKNDSLMESTNLSIEESQNNDQTQVRNTEVTPMVTFDPSQVKSEDALKPTATNETRATQSSCKRPVSSKNSPSSSSKVSSSTCLRKVVPLQTQIPALSNTKKTAAVREKMCRSPRTSSAIRPSGLARSTAASAKRTATPKTPPPLTQAPPPLKPDLPPLTQTPPPLTQAPPIHKPNPPSLTQTPPTLTQAPPPLTQTPPPLTQAPPIHKPNPPSLTQTPLPLTQAPPPLTQTPPPLTQAPPSLTQIPPLLTQTPPPLTQAPPPLTQTPPPLTQAPPSLTQIPPLLTRTPAGRPRKSSSALSVFIRRSRDKPAKPVWR